MDSRPTGGSNNLDSEQKQPQSNKDQRAPTKQPDLPIASQLPAWDLTPADTLLVRRRPAK